MANKQVEFVKIYTDEEWRLKFMVILGMEEYYENVDLIDMIHSDHRQVLYDLLCIYGDVRKAMTALDVIKNVPDSVYHSSLAAISQGHVTKIIDRINKSTECNHEFNMVTTTDVQPTIKGICIKCNELITWK